MEVDRNKPPITYCVVFSNQSFVAQGRKLLQGQGGSAALCSRGAYDGVKRELTSDCGSRTPVSFFAALLQLGRYNTPGGCKNKRSRWGPYLWVQFVG